MMMATLLTHDNPNLNIWQIIQDNAATGIGMSVELCKVNHDVNAAGNCNTGKNDKNVV